MHQVKCLWQHGNAIKNMKDEFNCLKKIWKLILCLGNCFEEILGLFCLSTVSAVKQATIILSLLDKII